jgi:PAS domain S-box-containing protein
VSPLGKDLQGQVFFSIGIENLLENGKIRDGLIIDYGLNEFLEYLDAIKILGDNPIWAFTADGSVLKQPEHQQAMFDPRPYLQREVAQERTLLLVEGGLLVYQDFFITPDAPLVRVAISIPETLLLDDIRSMLRFVFIVFLLLLAVSTVIAYYVSRYFSRPLVRLAHAADRLAQGDLSAQVDTSATGEVQMLVKSFNRMAADLERTTVSRDYMDNIVSSMMDTLIVVSPEGSVIRLNEAACFLLGYQEEELIGQPFSLVLGGGPGGTDNGIADVLARGSISNQERWYRGSDGRRIPVLFSASVLRDAQGQVQGVVCVAQDITERKRDEAKLKSYSEELALINDDLRNFAYIVSHDLRAPLVNIRGFSDELIYSIRELTPLLMAYLDRFDEEQRSKYLTVIEKDIPEALQFIGTSVSRMDNLITAILKLSRVGRRRLNPEPIQTAAFVQGILNSLAHQIERRRIQVVVEPLPDMIADRTALEQIFGNLLDNAIKYLDPGRPGRIVVGADHDGRDIVFHICDNGRGMASEDVPKAFDIFRRVGPQDVPGEGMGLAYVKTLLRLLGGRIWCESQVGAGTTFSFSVPAAPPEPEGLQDVDGPLPGAAGGGAPSRPGAISP